MKESDKQFLRGVLVALDIVNSFGHETCYDNIVGVCGTPAEFWTVAEEHDRKHLRVRGYAPGGPNRRRR